jgi:hypothetical protein
LVKCPEAYRKYLNCVAVHAVAPAAHHMLGDLASDRPALVRLKATWSDDVSSSSMHWQLFAAASSNPRQFPPSFRLLVSGVPDREVPVVLDLDARLAVLDRAPAR